MELIILDHRPKNSRPICHYDLMLCGAALEEQLTKFLAGNNHHKYNEVPRSAESSRGCCRRNKGIDRIKNPCVV